MFQSLRGNRPVPPTSQPQFQGTLYCHCLDTLAPSNDTETISIYYRFSLGYFPTSLYDLINPVYTSLP